MTAPHDFDTSSRVGWLGEEFLLEAHPDLQRAPDGERRWDLIRRTPPFARVEVKTDTYPMGSTPNFAMERRTVFHGGGRAPLDGGPWRAARDGVDELCYLFRNGGTAAAPSDPVAYWFTDVPALVAELERLIAGGVAAPRRVRNARVSAIVRLVPRDALLEYLPSVVVVNYVREMDDEARGRYLNLEGGP